MSTGGSFEQKDDFKSLLTFLHMRDRMKDIVITEHYTMKNMRLKSGNALGVISVLQVLCKEDGYSKKLFGKTGEQKALNRQWLEFNLSYLVGNTFIPPNLLKELDFALQKFTFFSGNVVSLADLMIYLSLYPTIKEMRLEDKEKYVHLSRWFRLVQEYDELRGDRVKVQFTRTPIYFF